MLYVAFVKNKPGTVLGNRGYPAFLASVLVNRHSLNLT